MSAPSFYEYRDYQVEDFVMDEAFQQWVRHADTDANQFWQQFLVTYPHQRETVAEARALVQNILYQPYTLSQTRRQQILEAAYHQAAKSHSARKQKLSRPSSRKYWAVAATASLLLISALVFWLWLPAYDTYETSYQENKTIQLADGSEVTLNANTRLKVNIDTEVDQPREVWLEGEAYFHVSRLDSPGVENTPMRRNFIVHADNFDVEVLGTTFNVTSRSEKSEVLLKSGTVKVASPQIAQTQVLQPGDLLTLAEEDRKFRLKKTETDTDLAWRENFFVFENTPLHQVARTIENYYGLEVTIADQKLGDKIFTAKISRDQLSMLLKAIEASFGVKVIQEKGTVRIQL